jgi:HK97 family phage portal protein
MMLRRALESRMPVFGGSYDIAEYASGLKILFGGGPTSSGVTINEGSAETLSSVYACVGFLTDQIAQVRCSLVDVTTKAPIRDSMLYTVLHDLPNPEMTAFDFRQTMMRWLLLWGNAYAQVMRDGSGQVIALWPLRTDRMKVDRTRGGTLRYTYDLPDGTKQAFAFNGDRPPIHHWRINALDGINGRSPIRLLRESLGLTKAAEEFGARWFGSGSRPSGILTSDQKLTVDGAKRMRDDWERLHAGTDQAHKVAVLEQGLKFQPITVPPEDAQFLETRNFQIEEVARIYRIPPYAIGHTKNSTSWGSGIESQKNGLVTFTIDPHLEQIAEASRRDFLGRRGFERYDIVHDTTKLQRGDLATRMGAYSTGLNAGVYRVNEVRAMEGLPAIDGGDEPMPFLSTSGAQANVGRTTPDGEGGTA